MSATLHTYSGFVYNGSQPTTQVAERAIPDTTGVVFIQDNTVVSVLNPSTGQTLGSVDIEDGNNDYDQQGKFVGPIFGNMIVAGDGNAYLPYTYRNGTGSNSGAGYSDIQRDTYLMLLRVSPDGTYAKTELRSWHKHTVTTPLFSSSQGNSGLYLTSSGSDIDYTLNGPGIQYSVITNADAGVAVFATVYPDATCAVEIFYTVDGTNYEQTSGCPDTTIQELISYVSHDGVTSQMDFTTLPHFVPALQREDGSYVGSDTYEVNHIVAAIGPDGSLLWQQPIDANFTTPTPLYATSDGGVIVRSTPLVSGPSTLYTLDQDGNVTSQTADTGAVVSWSGYSFADPAGTLSELSLPLVDVDPGNFGAVVGGNPSHNGAAFPPCPCIASLAWVFGAAPNIPTRVPQPKQDVEKSYPADTACTKTPSQLISGMETNFGSFANFSGYSSYNHIPWAVKATATFSGTVLQGATVSISNTDVDTLTGGHIKTMTFNVAVQVTQLDATSFTFTTLPGHVLYPATISFAASSHQTGQLHFSINVNGKFANKAAEEGYRAAGSGIEDHIWNHVLAQVKVSCGP